MDITITEQIDSTVIRTTYEGVFSARVITSSVGVPILKLFSGESIVGVVPLSPGIAVDMCDGDNVF